MALKAADKQRWAEIDSVIAEHKATLKAAKSHEALKDFATEQGWMNAADFPKYKRSLTRIGVFYDQLREQTFAEQQARKAEELAQLDDDAPRVILWTAACEAEDGSEASFALVNAEREAVWFGKFFDEDRVRVPGDLISAEQSAANKAVWLGAKALEAAGHEHGWVEIITTCPELDLAMLKADGVRNGVGVEVVVSDDERAVVMAEQPGFARWQDCDLAGLVESE